MGGEREWEVGVGCGRCMVVMLFMVTAMAAHNSSFGTVPKEIPMTYCSWRFFF